MFNSDNMYIQSLYSVIYVEWDFIKRVDHGIPKHYELVYFLSGDGETHFNGKTVPVPAGTIEFLPRKTGDEYYVIHKSEGSCIDIFFDTDFPMPEEAFSVNVAENPKIKELFFKIYKLWVQKSNGYRYKCMALLYSIFAELKIMESRYLPNNKYKKIEPGIAYINEHLFDHNIDFHTPCAVSGISYTYFKRLFIEKFSMPPVQYVMKKRLEYALELIRLNRFSILETATRCGFENQYYFSRVFKKAFGVSPSEYQKNSN